MRFGGRVKGFITVLMVLFIGLDEEGSNVDVMGITAATVSVRCGRAEMTMH